MNAFRAILMVGAIFVAPSAGASMLGPGGASCMTWIQDRQRNEAHSQLSQAWVLGFVTGYIIYKPPQRLTPRQTEPTRC